MSTCKDCKGTGKLLLTVHAVGGEELGFATGITQSEIPCVRCDGTGQDIGRVFLEDTITWCHCTEEEWEFGSYPQYGECKCGVAKEHVHCATCGNISQLG